MDNIHTPIIVGKFAIESLTVGMYDNALCIYREYIQNSADAIDKAIEQGLVSKKEARIHIWIEPNDKTIVFEDTGTGIPQHKFVLSLQTVAQSEKISGKDKGFRGIGRLGGLGYCEELIFESSVKGENVKSIMIWDAQKLKKMVSDPATKEGAAEVIRSVTTFKMEKEAIDKHYFKVSMNGVTNADLLNVAQVTEYLSMVAPVPYKATFNFRTQIYNYMKALNVSIDEYKLYVNTEEIFKAHTIEIYKKVSPSSEKRDKIKDVIDIKLFHQYNEQNELLFAGWHSITDKVNQLEAINIARGLRLRKGNIQIGDENRLESLYGGSGDSRFNFHAIGEVFTFHPKLIPNGRRDDFEENEVYLALQKDLRPICKGIKDLSYQISKITNAIRRIDEAREAETAFEQKEAEAGFISVEEIAVKMDALKKKQEEAEKGKKELDRIKQAAYSKGETSANVTIFESIVTEQVKTTIEIITEKVLVKSSNELIAPPVPTDKQPSLFDKPADTKKKPILPRVQNEYNVLPNISTNKQPLPTPKPIVSKERPVSPATSNNHKPNIVPASKPPVMDSKPNRTASPKTAPPPKKLFRADKLNLPEDQRKLMSQVYEILRRTLDENKTEIVIRKIEETFK